MGALELSGEPTSSANSRQRPLAARPLPGGEDTAAAAPPPLPLPLPCWGVEIVRRPTVLERARARSCERPLTLPGRGGRGGEASSLPLLEASRMARAFARARRDMACDALRRRGSRRALSKAAAEDAEEDVVAAAEAEAEAEAVVAAVAEAAAEAAAEPGAVVDAAVGAAAVGAAAAGAAAVDVAAKDAAAVDAAAAGGGGANCTGCMGCC